TLIWETPRASAVSRWDQPCCARDKARNLRHSRPSAGRKSGTSMPLIVYLRGCNLHCAAVSKEKRYSSARLARIRSTLEFGLGPLGRHAVWTGDDYQILVWLDDDGL